MNVLKARKTAVDKWWTELRGYHSVGEWYHHIFENTPLEGTWIEFRWRPLAWKLNKVNDLRWKVPAFIRRGRTGYGGERDAWNLHSYLSPIILAGLKDLKEDKMGIPWAVFPPDAQEPVDSWRMHSKEDSKIAEAMWTWALDDMIAAFELLADDDVYIPTDEQNEVIEQGLRLFGQFYRGLWS